MHVSGLDWTARVVEDYEKAKQFFLEKLGLVLVFEGKKTVMAHFRFPSGQLFEIFGPGTRDQQPGLFGWYDGHALGFDVQDIEASRQEMIDRGVHFIQGIETWKDEAWSMFLGPENRLLQIQKPGTPHPVEGAKVSAFSWFGLVVQDFSAARQFFAETMDMPLAREDKSATFAQFQTADEHRLEIIGPQHPWHKFLKKLTIGFEVADLQRLKGELQEMGVQFIEAVPPNQDNGLWAFFYGPDGYPYALWERR